MKRLLLLLLCCSTALFAEDAREMFQAGSRAMSAGDYNQAVKDFEGAYALEPAPSLLFYMAEAHRLAGQKDKAERFYAQYLHDMPNGPKVAEAREQLAALKSSGKKNQTLNLAEVDLGNAPAASAAGTPPASTRKHRRGRKTRSAAPAADAPPALVLPGTEAPAAVASAPAAPPLSAAPSAPAPVTVAAAPPPAVASQAPAAQPAPAVRTAGAAGSPVAARASQPASTASAATPTRRSLLSTTPSASSLSFVSYTGRFVVVSGNTMRRYASYVFGNDNALYTHGVAFGKQSGQFKQAVYVGFGTEFGGGSDTLYRYELSYQFAWAPLGPESIVGPHLGLRAGGFMATSEAVTGGSMKTGIVLAPEAGLDFQVGRHFVITAAAGYDANLGPTLGADSSLSGYALDLGGSLRF